MENAQVFNAFLSKLLTKFFIKKKTPKITTIHF